MPTLTGIDVKRAWRHTSQPGRIHFVIGTAGGQERRLWQDEETELGRVLAAALAAVGYTGPSSDHEE
jgi:hypothetical protein